MIMNQEIEIKIQISSEQLELLRDWLKGNAEFIKSIHHEEFYLNNPVSSFMFQNEILDNIWDADDYLRIRKTEKGSSMCLKKWHKDLEKPGYHTHCDEYEFDISDSEKSLAMMENLGFTERTEVIKDRELFETEDFEIVIDNVKNLGIFVEIECRRNYDKPKEGKEDIYKFLKNIGISKFKEQARGYVSMLWNKDHEFGDEVTL